MDNEVEVNYLACKCNMSTLFSSKKMSILLILGCTELTLFVVAVEKCKYLSKSVPEITRRV